MGRRRRRRRREEKEKNWQLCQLPAACYIVLCRNMMGASGLGVRAMLILP